MKAVKLSGASSCAKSRRGGLWAAAFVTGLCFPATLLQAQAVSPVPMAAAPPSSVPTVAAPSIETGSAQRSSQPSASAQQQTGAATSQDGRRSQPEAGPAIPPAQSVTDVPTEFQRLVTESTGERLPIFGASLFTGVPSTFAPGNDIPVGGEYVIGPGDTLRVSLYGQINQQENFTVDRTGNIIIPEIGPVHVAGVKYGDLPAFLKAQLSRVFRNFNLTVNLSDLRSTQIFVLGNARRPGSYTVSSLSTLLNALFVSGGPLPQGSLRDIQLLRKNAPIVHFDLYDVLLHGNKSSDVPLEPGDVIFIPPVGEQVAISGSVNNPAIYEIKPGTTVAALIALAGGQTQVALGARIRLERIYEHSMRYLEDVDPAQEGSFPLENGDVVSIGTILDRYRDSVTLRGNVAYPGRYVWRRGLRIRDVVPDQDALVTRDYYRRRNSLSRPDTGYRTGEQGGELQVGGSATTQASDAATRNGLTNSSAGGGGSVGSALTSSNNPFPASTDVQLSAPDIDWSYAVVERLDRRTLKTSLIPFNPGKLFIDNDQTQNLELLSGDVITFFSNADLRVPTAQQTRFVRLEGEFVASGVYSVQEGETLRHLLERAGGFTSDAYLYGSEFTRESTRRVQQQRLNEYADSLEAEISVYATSANSHAVSDRDVSAAEAAVTDARQSVARLRQLHPQGRIVLDLTPESHGVESVPDLALEDGDRFVVPRTPATVAVEGRVYSANAFVYSPALNVTAYLKKAGGPDRDADQKRIFILRADGSVLSRQYGDVNRAKMYPGDTLVVPPQLNRRAILRDLVDISSVIGGFGLGAAEINVLR